MWSQALGTQRFRRALALVACGQSLLLTIDCFLARRDSRLVNIHLVSVLFASILINTITQAPRVIHLSVDIANPCAYIPRNKWIIAVLHCSFKVSLILTLVENILPSWLQPSHLINEYTVSRSRVFSYWPRCSQQRSEGSPFLPWQYLVISGSRRRSNPSKMAG